MWRHEHNNWKDFTWDADALASKLADIRHRQGRLLGRMEELGFDLRREASLATLTNDVVKSSAIEGETLTSASGEPRRCDCRSGAHVFGNQAFL